VQNTLHSRIRRAITCVYCDPKSKMTICSIIERQTFVNSLPTLASKFVSFWSAAASVARRRFERAKAYCVALGRAASRCACRRTPKTIFAALCLCCLGIGQACAGATNSFFAHETSLGERFLAGLFDPKL